MLFQKSVNELSNDCELLFAFPLSILNTILLILLFSSLTLGVAEAVFE